MPSISSYTFRPVLKDLIFESFRFSILQTTTLFYILFQILYFWDIFFDIFSLIFQILPFFYINNIVLIRLHYITNFYIHVKRAFSTKYFFL